MYLLVESGSTKADWVLFDKNTEFQFETPGLNPTNLKADQLLEHLLKAKALIKQLPERIYFYGAGTSSPTAQSVLQNYLQSVFTTRQIFISNDLLAAGRSLCNQQPGIIILLGTGSHAALCDGYEIMHKLPSLGYLLSDEGSGNHLGKEILKAYIYEELNTALSTTFKQCYPEVADSDFIYSLYQSPNIPAQLANYGSFVIKNKEENDCKKIINSCLESFIHQKLNVYKDHAGVPVHACGSVAFYLQDELRIKLQAHGFDSGNISQKPLSGLLSFHRDQYESEK